MNAFREVLGGWLAVDSASVAPGQSEMLLLSLENRFGMSCAMSL
jgi:hypothetical protein